MAVSIDASVLVAAGLAGVAGRAMCLSEEHISPFSREMLWQVPTGFAMGCIGWGCGERFLGLDGLLLFCCAIGASFIGPRPVLGWVVNVANRYLPRGAGVSLPVPADPPPSTTTPTQPGANP
jgi:hypothetical protein